MNAGLRQTERSERKRHKEATAQARGMKTRTAGIKDANACPLSRQQGYGCLSRLSIHSICPYSVASDVQCSFIGVTRASLGHFSVFHTA